MSSSSFSLSISSSSSSLCFSPPPPPPPPPPAISYVPVASRSPSLAAPSLPLAAPSPSPLLQLRLWIADHAFGYPRRHSHTKYHENSPRLQLHTPSKTGSWSPSLPRDFGWCTTPPLGTVLKAGMRSRPACKTAEGLRRGGV
ncbi:hypothetical protein E2C01_001459 [Portunus trituberculatus]|uniref:Uncharacterized protein n=1 Tax=Portunus trituberculatus TaxID=210409 RepID=A0A5B7CHW0_PORTR|nr:hypothetical protein [Portunus trituberculatus]